MSEQVVQEETPDLEQQLEEAGPLPEGGAGRTQVNLKDLPDEAQKRFRRIYGSMKEYEAQNGQLLKDTKHLAKKVEVLQARLEEFGKDAATQRREELNAKKAAAYQEGDIERVMQIDGQIEKLREPAPIPEPDPEPEGLSPHLANRISGWSNEIDEEGNYLRPWSHPTHPKFKDAVAIAQEVANSPRYRDLDTDSVLEAIDRKVKDELFPKKKERVQAVLSGDGTAPPAGKPANLTPEMKAIAYRIYPKMSRADAEKRYAKAMKDMDNE